MITAGEVGAVFAVKDEASAVLKALQDQFNALQISIDKVRLGLSELKFPPGLNQSIGNMDRALASAGTTAESMSGKVSGGFVKIDESIAVTQSRLSALKAEMATVGSGLGRVNVANGLPVAVGEGRAPSGLRNEEGALERRAHGRGATMRTNHEIVPGVSLGEQHGLSGPVVLGVGAGFSLYESWKNSVPVETVMSQLAGMNVSAPEAEKLRAAAFRLSDGTPIPASGILKMAADVINPLNKGSTPDSGVESVLPHLKTLTEAMTVLQGLDAKTGGDVGKQAYDLVKSAEFRNAIGDKDFDKAISAMVRGSLATGGIVSPADWLKFSKYARGALPGLSNDFLYGIAPELMQEFGGAQAGTALAAVYQQIVSGQMRTTGMKLLDQLGYIDPKKVEYDHNGRIVRLLPGANVKAGEFQAEPALFAANLVQDLASKVTSDPAMQRQWIAQIFGNRNSAQMMQTLGYMSGRLERGAQGIGNTKELDDLFQQYLKGNPETIAKTTEASWQNMWASTGPLVTVSENLMGAATMLMNQVGALFRSGQILAPTPDGWFGGLNLGDIVPQIGKPEPGNAVNPAFWRDLAALQKLLGGSAPPAYLATMPNLAGVGAPNVPHVGAPAVPGIASAPPPINANVSANLTGQATATFGSLNVNIDGKSVAAALKGEIEGMISGLFSKLGQSVTGPNTPDGHAMPIYPDHVMHGPH